METVHISPPIACTLSAGEFQQRGDSIAALNAGALRSAVRDGLRLVLTYEPHAAERVKEMVDRERQCCAFLNFDLEESLTGVRLIVTAPEEAREAADLVFAPLQNSAVRDASFDGRCGCGR